MGIRYSKEVKRKAVDMYASGMSLAAVADVIGCSNRSIMHWVRDFEDVELRSNKGTPEERFWRKVEKRDVDECWNWRASCEVSGYGKLRVGNTMIKAHRFSWELHRGPIPNGMCVLHHCDNPPCVNPRHLWLGTRADNNRDRERKGRGGQLRGEESPTAKLTRDDVIAIRNKFDEGYSLSKLAQEFDVAPTTISAVVTKKTWQHVA